MHEGIELLYEALYNAAENMLCKTDKVRSKHITQPRWWDKYCTAAISEKYAALKKFRKTNTDRDSINYIISRDECKTLCKEKSLAYKSKLTSDLLLYSDDPNTFWKCVKNLNTDNSRTRNTYELTNVQWFQYFYKLLNKECKVSENFNDYVNLHDEKM